MRSSVLNNVITAATTYDLTDLPTVKDELQIGSGDTQHDNWMKRTISQTSKAIANYCNRVFPLELVSDTFTFENVSMRAPPKTDMHALKLERWPVLQVNSVVENSVTLVEGTDFKVDYDSGLLYRLTDDTLMTRMWPGLQTIVTYIAGHGAKATQVSAIPATPGPYTITITNSAAFFLDAGVTFVGGAALVAVATAPAAGQYSVAKGVYTFNAADQAKNVSIVYSYTVIPFDIVEATLRLITMRFKQRGRDPMLVSSESPGIGTQRWWVGPAPGQRGAFPPEIDSVLEPYCVPVVA